HRHHHEKLGSVYAYTSELDAWSAGRRRQIEHQPARAEWLASRRFVVPGALLSLALTAAAGAYVWRAVRSTPTRAPAVTSLAVLPFQPLGGTTRDEALELGMTDAVITRLENVRQIRVRPTSAVLKYAGAQPDLEAAGRELRVDVLVEGKIQRVADRIRVTVHLLRVQDGASLWAETLDEEFTSIFAVQDSISHQVARALPLTLSTEEANRLTRRDTKIAQAYPFYLKGRHFSSKRGQDALRKAVDYFEQAIRLDPTYARAYGGLADSFASWANSTVIPSKEAYLKARAPALRGPELEQRLADAHTALGVVSLFYDR